MDWDIDLYDKANQVYINDCIRVSNSFSFSRFPFILFLCQKTRMTESDANTGIQKLPRLRQNPGFRGFAGRVSLFLKKIRDRSARARARALVSPRPVVRLVSFLAANFETDDGAAARYAFSWSIQSAKVPRDKTVRRDTRRS